MKFGEKNVGTEDKIVRAIVGIGAFYAFLNSWLSAPLSYLLIAVAFAMFATAALGTCGVYTLLGIGTCSGKGSCPKVEM